MGHSDRGHFRGYVVACVAVAAAGLSIRLLQAVGYTGFSPLFAALIICAWYGGVGPAALGIVLTTLTAYYVLPKGSEGQLYHEDFLRASIFTLTAMVAVAVHLAARRAEEAAKMGKQAAEKANDAKTRLLAMVSHDLRGPLNPILMAVAVAESDPIVAERAQEPLRMIRSGVAEEVQLIEDLLDVARLATGKFKMNLTPVEVHKTLEKTLLSSQEKVREKRIDMETKLTATATSVKGDACRLQQVFWNLLCNAIKFTPAGGHIIVRSFDAPAGQIAIEVRDSGIGINSEKLPFIFHMFEQGGTDVTARFGGLGLGLTICRGIVEAHGGTITASSEGEGRGATFVVRLPLIMTQTDQRAGSSQMERAGAGNRA
ncbi:MAG: HAMP domain-containing sensor histidine kinase [Tepidisphaeraceae bacterium]